MEDPGERRGPDRGEGTTRSTTSPNTALAAPQELDGYLGKGDREARCGVRDLCSLVCVVHASPFSPPPPPPPPPPGFVPNSNSGKITLDLAISIHKGWAVEGAIGSDKKMDAGYVSPNIVITQKLSNIAVRLGTPVVLTGQFYESLPDEVKAMCRPIDAIVLSGQKSATEVFTFSADWSTDFSAIKDPEQHGSSKGSAHGHGHHSRVGELSATARINFTGEFAHFDAEYWTKGLSPDEQGSLRISKNADMRLLIKPFSRRFNIKYEKAVSKYREGNWEEAKAILMEAVQMAREMKLDVRDKPSEVLMEFMEKTSFKAPATWRGHRKLNYDWIKME